VKYFLDQRNFLDAGYRFFLRCFSCQKQNGLLKAEQKSVAAVSERRKSL